MTRRNRGGMGSLGASSATSGLDTSGNAIQALTPTDLANTGAAQTANYDLTSGANSPINEVNNASGSFSQPGAFATLFANLFGSRSNTVPMGARPGTIVTSGSGMSPVLLIALAAAGLYLITRKKST